MTKTKHRSSLQGFKTYKQWKSEMLLAWEKVEGVSVNLSRNTYYNIIVTGLEVELLIDVESAFSFFAELSKRYKGFMKYIESKTAYKNMLSFILKGETEKAKKEYERIFQDSPGLQFLKAKKLADAKQHQNALNLAVKILDKFEYDYETESEIHLLIAELKANLKRKDVEDSIEAAFDLFLKTLDGSETVEYISVLIYVYFAGSKVIGPSCQPLLAKKLSSKFSEEYIFELEEYIFAYFKLLDKDEADSPKKYSPWEIKKRLYNCERIITGLEPDSKKSNALALKAYTLKFLSRYEDAIPALKDSLDLAPDETKWWILADIQTSASLNEDAFFSISKALELDPENELFLEQKMEILQSLGKPKEALEIAKSLSKPAEDKIHLNEWILLLEMGEARQIVELYEKLEPNTLSAQDYIAWISSLYYENKMIQARELSIYLLDNFDSFPVKDDSFYLFYYYLLTEVRSFSYKNHDLYDIFIDHLLTIHPILFANLDREIAKDLVVALREKDKMAEIVKSIRESNSNFDLKQNALCNINIAIAREFLEDYRDLLGLLQYQKYDLRLSLLEGKILKQDLELEELISKLKDKEFDFMLRTAYENERYDAVNMFLDIRPSEQPLYIWYKFLACTFLGENAKAKQALESFDFDNLINSNKPFKSDTTISNRDVNFGMIMGSVDALFPSRFPYHMIALDNFTLLLKKTSDPSLHKSIDWTINYILKTMAQQANQLNISSAYGDEYDDLMVKKTMLDDLSKLLMFQEQKNAYASQCLRNRIYESILGRFTDIVDNIKSEERNKILANLSHSIKNMLRSVIDPLVNLKNEVPEKRTLIENAIKGANLIREIVNAINLSFKTSVDDLLWDSQNIGKDSLSLYEIVNNSLKYSIGNMFDFRYFPAYAGNYFPKTLKSADYQLIKDRWDSISQAKDISLITDFVNDTMFKLDIDLSEASNHRLGNEKSSAIKLMILFQEIIFNAVKYASFAAAEERFIDIQLKDHGQTLSLTVSNSYQPKVQAKTTGVGKLVIENFAKVLDCQPQITTTDQVYTISMEFNNIWRNHAQNPIH